MREETTHKTEAQIHRYYENKCLDPEVWNILQSECYNIETCNTEQFPMQ